jgi:tetratricopeptide (TPR) repeat protein
MTIRLTLLFILICSFSFAQKNKQKQKEEPKVIELTPQQKDSIVRSVYDRMYYASGTVKVKPDFKLKNNKSQVATYTPSKNSPQIVIEYDAFKVCQSFGDRIDDALAFLLSHEIGHHLTYDFWVGNYQDFTIQIKDSLIKKYGIETTVKNTSANTVKTLQEIKADEKGGILRYMAGYSSEGLSEQLFKAIYAEYTNLSDTMNCYPPLQERIAISKIADARAQSFQSIFEIANYSVLLKDYDFAIKQYNALIIEFDFHSREIYNNIGVVNYLKALELADEDDIKFIYPVELDLKSRIGADRGTKGVRNPKVVEFLMEANENFKKATSLDPTYSTGFLNIACIQTILGEDYDLAKSAAKKAVKLAKNEIEKQNAQLVLALIELNSEEGSKAKGEKMIDDLVNQGNDFAILNKEILSGKKWIDMVFTRPLNSAEAQNESYSFTNQKTFERINDLRDGSEISKVEYESSDLFKYGNPSQTLETYHMDNAKVQLVHTKYFFVTTKSNYVGSTSLGIKIGSTEKELKEKYGVPNIVIPSAQGWIYHYPRSSMMVVINSDRIVEKWMVYKDVY